MMRNNENSLLILTKSYSDDFENSSVFKNNSDRLFKKFEYETESVYLFNDVIELYNLELPESEFLYFTLTEKLDISGTLVKPLENLRVRVFGSITFVLNGLKESVYNNLNPFYNLEILSEYPELITMFNNRGITFFQEFIELYDGYTGTDSEIIRLWSIIDEVVKKRDEDYDSVLSEITYQLVFNELGLTTETEEETGRIICLLDGRLKVSTYITYYQFLVDELFELKSGDFQFGYSYWGEDHNQSLYEELGIDNGDYRSYPTLYFEDYRCDPETGYWYYS